MAAGIGKTYINEINKNKMKVLKTAEVDTVKELIDCFEEFVAHDGSNAYLMGKEKNGFTVELVENEVGNRYLAHDIRLTEKE